jgi:hypothetical protein
MWAEGGIDANADGIGIAGGATEWRFLGAGNAIRSAGKEVAAAESGLAAVHTLAATAVHGRAEQRAVLALGAATPRVTIEVRRAMVRPKGTHLGRGWGTITPIDRLRDADRVTFGSARTAVRAEATSAGATRSTQPRAIVEALADAPTGL